MHDDASSVSGRVSFGLSWDQIGFNLGSDWNQSRSVWDQSGMTVGSIWDHLGTILVSLWGQNPITNGRQSITFTFWCFPHFFKTSGRTTHRKRSIKPVQYIRDGPEDSGITHPIPGLLQLTQILQHFADGTYTRTAESFTSAPQAPRGGPTALLVTRRTVTVHPPYSVPPARRDNNKKEASAQHSRSNTSLTGQAL